MILSHRKFTWVLEVKKFEIAAESLIVRYSGSEAISRFLYHGRI